MFKYLLYILVLGVLAALAVGAFHLYKVNAKNKNEMAKFAGSKVEVSNNLGRVLVIYYSMSGHTRDIAERIREKTGGEIYEIRLDEKLPKGPMLHLAIKDQLKTGNYPKIKTDFPDMSKYDVIFFGAPVWWYTIATPALSFLDQVDFAGKKVVPFSTQGSNVGTFFEDFIKAAKNATILKGEKFNNMSKEYGDAVDNKISVWINEL